MESVSPGVGEIPVTGIPLLTKVSIKSKCKSSNATWRLVAILSLEVEHLPLRCFLLDLFILYFLKVVDGYVTCGSTHAWLDHPLNNSFKTDHLKGNESFIFY
jgi:hypothetical protein